MTATIDVAWIVDASVALKWFLPAEVEPDSDLARATVGVIPLQTTSLAYFEVGNILTRLKGFDSNRVKAALESMRGICGVPIDLNPADFGACAEIASTHGITFYDASYVTIARRINRTVLSADSGLLDPGLAQNLETAVGR